MATVFIQKRVGSKGKRYPVYYKDPVTGKNNYYKSYRRQRDAQDATNKLRRLLDTGDVAEVKSSKRKISLLTFDAVCRLLKEAWEGRVKRSELSEASYYGYCDRMNAVSREFGDRILCEILRDEIVKYRNKVASDCSNITSNRNLFILKQVFKRGLELSALKIDPASTIPYLSEKAHRRNEFLTPEQLDHLLKACQNLRSKESIPAIICLGAEHGASKQEILDLRWADIDFDFEGKGRIRFFRTKTTRERTEYLMPRTREALLKWRDHLQWMRRRKRVQDKGSGFVFSKLDGRRLNGFSRSWREARRLAGFPKFHFHDLRHTFCSNLILSGGDLKDAKEMIGHADLSMTDRYAHLTNMWKLAKQEDLARFYANSEETKEPSELHRSYTNRKNAGFGRK